MTVVKGRSVFANLNPVEIDVVLDDSINFHRRISSPDVRIDKGDISEILDESPLAFK
ncbi:hypothetical protein TIFTF001_022890 [Ficus carica]|uniref:Uncharacterized protein n=1 Tax=Ficus carica TaxID=3494 RepID=A0AA88AIN0_FICCA|nr:hypothetical protein TIFTF001_022890 [Ficus carica]